MATGLAVATAICRTAVTVLSAVAFACTIRAPEVRFVPLIFLKLALAVQLFWNVVRLIYDAAQVLFQVPLPLQLFTALIVADWVAMMVLLAAGSSAIGVLVFFQVDNRACGSWTLKLPMPCSYWHGASALLTLCASFFSVAVSLLIFWIRASADPHH